MFDCLIFLALGHLLILGFSLKIGNALFLKTEEVNNADGEYIRKNVAISIINRSRQDLYLTSCLVAQLCCGMIAVI
jgi:hypothetical protein